MVLAFQLAKYAPCSSHQQPCSIAAERSEAATDADELNIQQGVSRHRRD
jgi:hypothetical protein